MQPKKYQQRVLDDFSKFLDLVDEKGAPGEAYSALWQDQGVPVGPGGMPSYREAIKGCPHACLKVPTAGGKTFLALHALKQIFDRYPAGRPKVAAWLVPWDNIREQVLRAFRDASHPYAQALKELFGGKVVIYSKDDLLYGGTFNPVAIREQVSILVMGYSSLKKTRDKDARKVFQQNGNLTGFAEHFRPGMVEGADETALISVLNSLAPACVVDESHNAGTALSVEMLNNLSPSFVLDLTATPRDNANIVASVSARELKEEDMVKLPVVVWNLPSRDDVVQKAVALRAALEEKAKSLEAAGGKYVRPIVLFQAESDTSVTSDTYAKIKAKLVTAGIPEEQIAIKTADKNELRGVDLASRECHIRYILTVNALKEGWDCPFAYILASLANKSSAVDVEQILGRVLRQPYAQKSAERLLNLSYVFTASNKFNDTLENVVRGLEGAGFSRQDFRVASDAAPEPSIDQASVEVPPSLPVDGADFELQTLSGFVTGSIPAATVTDLVARAHAAEQAFMAAAATSPFETAYPSVPAHIRSTMPSPVSIKPDLLPRVAEMKIPQFFRRAPAGFDDGGVLLAPGDLLEGFTLATADALIPMEDFSAEVYEVDVDVAGSRPKYARSRSENQKYLMEYVESLPEEKQLQALGGTVVAELGKMDYVSDREVRDYVARALAGLSAASVAKAKELPYAFADKIKKKVATLSDAYARKKFLEWADSGEVVTVPNWEFRAIHVPSGEERSLTKGLYEREGGMNELELEIIGKAASCDNVLFWHRNESRRDFALNAWGNHYPDFIIGTASGTIILLETKGADRDNTDSADKLRLGKTWQSLSGQNFKYFMVFKENPIEGAYLVDRFIAMLQDL